MFVLDTHVDTPSMLLEGIDLNRRLGRGHVDFPRMREGGVDGAFFAIYIPKELNGNESVAHAIRLISKVYNAVDSSNGSAALTTSASDAYSNQKNRILSVFMGLENGSPIGHDLKMLRFFHKMGVRYMTLCHNADNQICDSAASASPRWGGLSPFGVDVVAEMNRIGMLIDVSHTSDNTFYDVLKYSKNPIVATHSCCRSLCGHRRNLTDEMIKDLASAGGVVQVNFYPFFLQDGFGNPELNSMIEQMEYWQSKYRNDLKDEVAQQNYYSILDKLNRYPSVSYKRIADHVDHVVSVADVDHVGLGSDFDGIEVTPEGLRDISTYYLVLDELKSRGYSDEELEKIAGKNFLRLL